ncbi:hypothetical protein X740_32335 [Mesorhizobium sp. LNHC221B00]|uniref:hypothetical protein n=1 Tax=Mesorhizobium sp. LNHC221B00 TaxID=1287233 RepID=UPI0003CDED18|nr:hypothetical protein [Mesorhizobium sp. LNHC221B00]ESY73675.1 hypothetical protein X740_32335 [Mesorhizobium sp. LNHC221B00]
MIAFLQTNASLVLANPVAFTIFAILFGSGGFAVGRYFLTERIANLESRIARRDDEIEALKKCRDKTAAPSLVPVIGTSAHRQSARTKQHYCWENGRTGVSQEQHRRHGVNVVAKLWLVGQSSSGVVTGSSTRNRN